MTAAKITAATIATMIVMADTMVEGTVLSSADCSTDTPPGAER
jgi:hypothetical protein